MLNVWILERPDKEATAEAIRLMTLQASANGLDREMIHWRVLPESRLWQECIAVVKDKIEEKFTPDIIEYPFSWRTSLEYLKLFAPSDSLPQNLENRWTDLYGRVLEGKPDSKTLSLPWLTGLMTLSYRRDILKRLAKTPEDLEDYDSWRQTLIQARGLNNKGETLKALTLEGLGASKFVPVDLMTTLWWIWIFGGEFLDPLTLGPAFTQAEAIQGIASMVEIFIELSRNGHGRGSLPLGAQFADARSFPQNAFCCLGFSLPRALKESNPQIGVILPPKKARRLVPAREYALAITKKATEGKANAALSFCETIFENDFWVTLARTFNYLPSKRALWETFFAGIENQMLSEVYLSGAAFAKKAQEGPFLASLTKIFEETLEDVTLKTLRDGFVDTAGFSAELTRAASEYRLVSALYGDFHGH